MMNNKRIHILILSILACVAFSCTDYQEENVPEGLSVDSSKLSFGSGYTSSGESSIESLTRTMKVRSGSKWSVGEMPEWLKVQSIDAASAAFEWNVTFAASQNDGYDREGTVALSAGAETVSVSLSQQGRRGTYVAVESVSISPESLTLTEGDSFKLTGSVIPSNASEKDLWWSSDNTSVATVAYDGTVTAVAEGTATITVETYDGRDGGGSVTKASNGKTATCVITVKAAVVPVTSVSLDKTSLTMTEGDTQTLTATVTPDNATDKSLTWSSSNTEVATVSTSGDVTAIKAGTATITVKTNDGGKTATCSVTVMATSGLEAIDLGLPSGLKWASCNIGASKPEEFGDYYAWGETETKSEYEWSTYKWCNGSSNSLTKYNTLSSYGTVDNKTKLENSDDVARVKLGGKWRMPTDAEWTELRTKCSWTWTTQNGVKGEKVTGPNGKSIFLPAAGYRSGTSLYHAGSSGFYWSSSLTTDDPDGAGGVYFDWGGVIRGSFDRYDGFSVRPVYDGNTVSVSSVSLNVTNLTMTEGETQTLTATVKPDNATDKSVTWSSNNTSVATVSSSGVVTAIKTGSATITVKTNDGGKTATCSVTVTATSYEQGAVDLGLPSGLKWGSCNIGASSPEEYGDYYAWGETETKSEYEWSTYKWCNGSYNSLTKYNTLSSYGTVDNKTKLESSDDVARVKLGGKWRMPTDAEWEELLTKCSWTWTTQNGVAGRKVTGPNGKSIFLPAAGGRSGASLYLAGSYGTYWSSSLTTDLPDGAWSVSFGSGGVGGSGNSRGNGFSVRPVSE